MGELLELATSSEESNFEHPHTSARTFAKPSTIKTTSKELSCKRKNSMAYISHPQFTYIDGLVGYTIGPSLLRIILIG